MFGQFDTLSDLMWKTLLHGRPTVCASLEPKSRERIQMRKVQRISPLMIERKNEPSDNDEDEDGVYRNEAKPDKCGVESSRTWTWSREEFARPNCQCFWRSVWIFIYFELFYIASLLALHRMKGSVRLLKDIWHVWLYVAIYLLISFDRKTWSWCRARWCGGLNLETRTLL